MGFQNILHFAHQLVTERVHPGDSVIDATMGGGNDTMFLSKLVGRSGNVYAFDVQQEAIEKTRQKLESDNHNESVHLLLHNHATMLEWIPAAAHGKIAAIMFNLGYLPGSDHAVITKATSTINALDAALSLLKVSGIITIAVYRGHEGAQAEEEAVLQWAKALPQHTWQVLRYEFVNQINLPPYLLAIEKRRH